MPERKTSPRRHLADKEIKAFMAKCKKLGIAVFRPRRQQKAALTAKYMLACHRINPEDPHQAHRMISDQYRSLEARA